MQSALNRHLQDLGRNKDIVRDKEFKSASHTLDKVMKVVTKTGGSRATQHNSVITSDELKNALLLSSCFIFSPSASAVCGSISLLILYLMGWYFITNSAQSFNFLRDSTNQAFNALKQLFCAHLLLNHQTFHRYLILLHVLTHECDIFEEYI